MNLREVMKNLSERDKQSVHATLTRNERLNAVAQNSDSTICAYEIPFMSIIYFRDDKWANYVSFEVIGNATLATDHATTIIKRDEMLELLKDEEITLDNLPEDWFVRVNDDTDSGLIAKAINKQLGRSHSEDLFFGVKLVGVVNQGWFVDSESTANQNSCVDVTHLFTKKPEQLQPDVVEIDGKRYRKIDTGGKFENGDLVYSDTNGILKFIAYDEGYAIVKTGVSFYPTKNELVKLEEIKVWHYAIYEFDDKSSITQLCDFKSDVEEIIANKIGVKKVTYLTHEQL